MLIFKRNKYNPWAFGPQAKFVGIKVNKLKGPFDLGKGFTGYIATSPDGTKTDVVEATTGAVVGSSLDQVRADIEACEDVSVMQAQVDQAKSWLKDVQMTSEEIYWG